METNLFSIKLFNMSTQNIKQLKTVLIKTIQQNSLPIDDQINNHSMLETDHKQRFSFVTDCLKDKQQIVNNLSNFILQFLDSLGEIFQQMKFKDTKIQDLKKTIIEQSEFVLKIQDQILQYKEKLINAEQYIHWMEEQTQYFDLLALTNPKYEKQNQLSKCRSQKTLNSSDIFIDNEISERKRKLDYERIKFYIQTLKQQKNYLIKQYNSLVDQHQKKLFECQKHTILLDELFQKYRTDPLTNCIRPSLIHKQKSFQPYTNPQIYRKCHSQKKLCNVSQDQVSISYFQNPQQHQPHSFHYIPQEPDFARFTPQKDHNFWRLQHDQSIIQNKSGLESFVSDVFYKHSIKMDVGTNTKKLYCVSNFCQTTLGQNQNLKPDVTSFKRKSVSNKMRVSQKTTMQESTDRQNSQIQCEISINLKNVSKNQFQSIDFSKLISRQVLAEKNKSRGYTKCQKQKRKGSKHLCQHIYCFLANKVVTDRIKTYKFPKK